jgi:hypothetical protein
MMNASSYIYTHTRHVDYRPQQRAIGPQRKEKVLNTSNNLLRFGILFCAFIYLR